MNCRIDRLELNNFKGVERFVLEAGGYSVDLFGDNASGKTTIADAWSWLTTDKDSSGRKDFDIKELDAAGDVRQHGLEHSVEAELIVDERRMTLRKVYAEKWTKRRGSSNPEFDGHETQHFVDGVPCRRGEYDAKVAELADAGALAQLTNTSYVADSMHWTKRRELIVDVCGDVTVDDIVSSRPDLEEVPAILDGKTIDDRKKVLKASFKQINNSLDEVPIKIAEASRALPEVTDDEEILRTHLQGLKEQRSDAEDKRAAISAGAATAEKKVRLREIDADVREIKTRIEQARRDAVADLEAKLADARGSANRAKSVASNVEAEIAGSRVEIERLETRMTDRRDRWHARNGETFDFEQAEKCPACEQPIPDWKLQEARDNAEAEFNRKKARDLTELQEEGKDLEARRDAIAAKVPPLERQLAQARTEREEAEAEIAQLSTAIDEAKKAAPELEDDADHKRLAEEALRLEGEISNVDDVVAQEREAARKAVEAIDANIESTQAMLARHAARASGLDRIQNLEQRQKDLAREAEAVERQIELLDAFTRAKVDLLTERINGKFEIARWKLFDEQINGGLAECCEVMHNGVPWRSMNHAARVQCGLDIIRTLQRHHGIAPPVFVDHSESVTTLPDMECQVVRLIVSEGDKDIRVETTHEPAMEAPAA